MQIKIENLSKKIKKNLVLNNINVTMDGGKIYGLQGKNGCGKTMLMRCIAGLVIPTDGKIMLGDKVLHKDISLPESIGVLIEKPSFLDNYTGFANLKMLAGLKDDKKVPKKEIEALLELVGLSNNGKKYGEYSLGMKQRLGIAAAIMGKPDIIILDEPVNAIDEDSVGGIREAILSLKAENRIIIIACHDKDEMNLFADEIFCMKEGEIYETITNTKE